MKNQIIAIVGLCGTGKSVAAKYLQDKFKLDTIYFGGFVLDEVKKRGLEINSTNEKIVREDLRQKHGPDVMAKLAIEKIKQYISEGKSVIIDGLYSFSEYTYLKEIFGDQLRLIAIHSAKINRYKRLGKRKIRPLSPQQVDERDFTEIKNIEKAGPIAVADYHVINDKGVQDLYHYLHYIFQKKIALPL